MTELNVVAKLGEYFETEYNDCVRFKQNQFCKTFSSYAQAVDNTIANMFGAAMFVQTLGADYDEVNDLYEKYRAKLEKLLDEY